MGTRPELILSGPITDHKLVILIPTHSFLASLSTHTQIPSCQQRQRGILFTIRSDVKPSMPFFPAKEIRHVLLTYTSFTLDSYKSRAGQSTEKDSVHIH